MTKLIVLCLTASAAVSLPGGKRLMLTGFSPMPIPCIKANDNEAPARPVIRLSART
jgi:hypothetical protein